MKIPLKRCWNLLAKHIRPQKGRFSMLSVLLLGSIALQIVNPQIMRYFIDTAISGNASESLTTAALAFMGIALLQQAVSVGARYLGENVAWTATNALRAEFARHCLYLDMGFHIGTSPGELIERIDGDVAELSDFFSELVIRVIGNLLLLAGVLGVLFLEDWRIGVAFTVFAAVTLYGMNRVRDLAIPHWKAFREANATCSAFWRNGLLEQRRSALAAR